MLFIIYMCIYIHVYIYDKHIYIYTHIYTFVIRARRELYQLPPLYTYLFIYTLIHIHMYIYTYLYTFVIRARRELYRLPHPEPNLPAIPLDLCRKLAPLKYGPLLDEYTSVFMWYGPLLRDKGSFQMNIGLLQMGTGRLILWIVCKNWRGPAPPICFLEAGT